MRPFHWLYAHAFGYFWEPCPICLRNFGGHTASAAPGHSIWPLPPHTTGKAICRRCASMGYADCYVWDARQGRAVFRELHEDRR